MRLVFLGCGFATRLHSKTLKGFSKKGVRRLYASRDGAKAREYNRRFRGSGFFDSYDEALSSEEVDIALVATPPVHHLDLVLQALRANKDVIVEKPPFLKSTDFDTVEEECRRTGRRVFVAENYYYKPVAVRLRQLVSSGIIGEVLLLQINATKLQKTDDWRGDPRLSGGGALFEGGIHWINFTANLGLTVRSVRGSEPQSPDGLQRSMLVTLQYEGGAVGSLHHSWEIPSTLKGLRLSKISGRKGSITFESNGLFVFANGTKKRLYFPRWRDIAGYKGMFADFIRAWQAGGEPQMNLQIARRDLEMIETIYRTAAES